MKYIILLSFICLSYAQAEDNILCIEKSTAPIFNKDLNQVIFFGRQYETVVESQDFGQKDGTKSNYVRVELTDREEDEADNNVGWLDKSLIQSKSKCVGYKEPIVKIQATTPVIPDSQTIYGLPGNCCLFPMKKHPTVSFIEGMRRFGASRSRGARLHAAADLYQSQYQPVYAIAAGKVLRDRVSFYLGTNVTEIQHTGGFIARYGEIASDNLKPLKLGPTVKAGQLIGYIKKVNAESVKSPMLHFELYTGKASGPLTVVKSGNKFQRRSDLINPTKYLTLWEKNL